MKIDSTNEIASVLLELSQTHDNLDITDVTTIIGTSCEIIDIITSDKFSGFNAQNIMINDVVDSNKLSFIQENTTATIVQPQE